MSAQVLVRKRSCASVGGKSVGGASFPVAAEFRTPILHKNNAIVERCQNVECLFARVLAHPLQWGRSNHLSL
jgi:hypothetical protein